MHKAGISGSQSCGELAPRDEVLLKVLHVPQDIVAEFPDYLDAYLRLACIERKQGNLKKAIEWAEKGVDRAEASSKGSTSHTDLLAMAGLYL